MTAQPFLSVVIPTYNRCDSLRITLTALARQNAFDGGFEVVVVSDGATDGTEALLAALKNTVPYPLKVIAQKNGGPARARNRGVREACGTVIVFLDDDVEPLPECLAAHARRHRSEEKIVVIGPMSPDPERRHSEPCWIAWEHGMLQKQYDAWRTNLWREDECGPHNFYTGNASLRREYIRAVGGFDEGFTRQEDVELATRVAQRCGVYFRFDASTDALHRPRRTYASWRKTPYAYGQLDVVRAQRSNTNRAWDVVRHGFWARNRATKLLAQRALPAPPLAFLAERTLRVLAIAAWKLPTHAAEKVALAALSAIYNVRYLEGARDQLGSWDRLRGVLGAEFSGVKAQERTA